MVKKKLFNDFLLPKRNAKPLNISAVPSHEKDTSAPPKINSEAKKLLDKLILLRLSRPKLRPNTQDYRDIIKNMLGSLLPMFGISLPRKEKKLQRLLKKVKDPNDILKLITQYEKLAQEMKENNEEGADDILKIIVKLKMLLLNLFKKKQHELLEMYWRQINEENTKFIQKLKEDLASLRKRLAKKKN